MNHTDQRIDDYISKSADFAKPILIRLRRLIHQGCPDIKETWKWSFPHFEYNGSILCSMASFKQHCAFGFWLSSKMKDPHNILSVGDERTAMGSLGRIETSADLPSDDLLIEYIKQAMDLIDKGVKLSKPANVKGQKELTVPGFFMEALKKNRKALETFEAFNYSNKKDYVEWITGAKSEDTRKKRLDTAIGWMAEGKIRNWKYTR